MQELTRNQRFKVKLSKHLISWSESQIEIYSI
jgi:hypothetical protein